MEIQNNVSEQCINESEYCDPAVQECQSTKPRKNEYTKNTHVIINDYVDSIDFGLLPEGWIRLRHISGIVIFLHRITRVVTLSRPYSVGPGSVRHHQIPVVALPCLAYRKARPAEAKATSSNVELDKATETASSDHEIDSTSCIKTTDSVLSTDDPKSEVSSKSSRGREGRKRSAIKMAELDSVSVSQEKCHFSDENLPIPKLDKEEGELSSGEDEDDDEDDADSASTSGQLRKRGRYEQLSSSTSCQKASGPSRIRCSESNPNSRVRRTDVIAEEDSTSGATTTKPTVLTPMEGVVAVPAVGGGRRRRRRRIPAACPRVVVPTQPLLAEAIGSTGAPPGDAQSNAITELSSVKTQVFAVKDKEVESLLSVEEIRAYCSRLFEIQIQPVTSKRHNREEDSTSVVTEHKASQNRVLMMPEEAKVIRYQLPAPDGDPLRGPSKEGLINLTGKSYVCILHEYCQNVIRRPPTYQTVVQENDRNPYQLTVLIDGKPCATGSGQSKKQARLDAARNALARLIPDFEKIVGSDAQSNGPSPASERDLQLFDSISITDPRLYELSVRMALPTPYNLLLECLNRSCVPESDLKSNMISHGRSKHFFTLQLNERSVKVPCKNKREGRHLAAQHLLVRLHPEVTMWSDLLRMYGPGSKPDKKTELETIQGAQAQEKSAVKTSLIRLLKAKMRELAAQWEENGGNAHPKGKFFVSPDSLPVVTFHPDSKTDLYNSIPESTNSPVLPSSPTTVSD